MKLKKLICLLLVACLCVSAAACDLIATEPKALSAPQNVAVSGDGLITWGAVENAQGYYVFINEAQNQTEQTSYNLADTTVDSVIYVKAFAEGFSDSPASQRVTFTAKAQTPKKLEISLDCTVDGKQTATVKAGQTVKFTAQISGAQTEDDKKIRFEVENDGAAIEGAKTANSIEFTGSDVTGDKILKVTAVSEADPTVKATKAVTSVAKTELTNEMVQALCGENEIISFDGFIMIDIYTETDLGAGGIRETLVQSNTVTMRTAMKTGKWYAEYENASIGISQQIFFECDDQGYACETTLDFNNRLSRYPLKTANGDKVLWSEAGYYNCFKGLTAADFTFNEQSWRWQYKYAGSELVKNMVASCNPYDFFVDDKGTFELIIDDGEIIGICAASGKDYSIVSGYMAKQRLYVALDASDSAEVPVMQGYVKIDDYEDAPTKAEYRKLQTAIANMQALTSYKTELINVSAMQGLASTTVSGYQEVVTPDVCYFRPYTSSYASSEIFTDEGSYGYRNSSDYPGVYNTFFYTEAEDGDYIYAPTRSYRGSVSDATPDFDFCAEIFNRGCYYDEEAELTRFIADDAMSTVATEFYSGVGNDINLYGLFAAIGVSGTTEFATYVDVQAVNGDYYIVGSGFYYSIDSQGFYGVVDITYSDFNTATVADKDLTRINAFTSKPLPSKWNDVNIIAEYETETLIPAGDYFANYFFGKNGIPALSGITAEEIPFFSDADALGDTFGLGMPQIYQKPVGNSYKAINTVKLYYDVPLDMDYTINSSLDKIDAFLKSKGFAKAADGSGEYRKTGCNLVIKPADEGLDLFVYLWAE